jgi:FHA domain-containing protein
MLRQFERRLEQLVEGAFSKAFRSGLQPVEVGRRLEREVDRSRTLGVRSTIVANHYTIQLAPSDHERFSAFDDALLNDLGGLVRAHAREER